MNNDNHTSDMGDDRDRMQRSFDELRLVAAQGRLRAEETRKNLPSIDSGNPETDASIQRTLSLLLDTSVARANAMDEAADYYQPLYEADKRAGRAGPHVHDTHSKADENTGETNT